VIFVELLKDDFLERIEKGVFIVDFFATWCGPCKMLSPLLDEVLEGYVNKVSFIKVDVDKFRDLAINYKVRGVPTVICFKDGLPYKEFSGYIPKQRIVDFIEDCLK
jgi:thioredoxin 1